MKNDVMKGERARDERYVDSATKIPFLSIR